MAFLTETENEVEKLEKQIDLLQEQKENLEKETNKQEKTIRGLTQLDNIIKIDFEYLEDFEPTQIKALINLINTIQRQVADDSLTIRVVDGIAHRDGAVRSLGILKANLKKLLKDIKKT